MLFTTSSRFNSLTSKDYFRHLLAGTIILTSRYRVLVPVPISLTTPDGTGTYHMPRNLKNYRDYCTTDAEDFEIDSKGHVKKSAGVSSFEKDYVRITGLRTLSTVYCVLSTGTYYVL